MEKSITKINERIREGTVVVVTAEEMPDLVDELGEEGALEKVDVVTTGTFGAMCSSGAFFNFGHSDPPIRMERVWMNEVGAYAGVASVDAYLGASAESETQGSGYGGAHVMEDLISGKSVELRASSKGTDCYPRRTLSTDLTLDDMNQAIMVNPRNGYQRYNAATNSTRNTLYTYMGTLLPDMGNVAYSGAGLLSPLPNDPGFGTIGGGSPIFLCGAPGIVVGEGTQSSPGSDFGTLMVTADMKQMDERFIRAATFTGYGVTLYVGLGIPIPVTSLDVVRNTAVRDEDIRTSIIDYGVPRRDRPTVREVTYADLKSGRVEIEGEEIRTSPLSSFRVARDVAQELKCWIEAGKMEMASPTRRINAKKVNQIMKETRTSPPVREIMSRKVVSVLIDEDITIAARKLMKVDINHLTVLNDSGELAGIVTTFDISKAVARSTGVKSVRDIMSTEVITTSPDEPVDIAAHKLKSNNISALPVTDSRNRVVGMLNAIDLGKLFEGRWVK